MRSDASPFRIAGLILLCLLLCGCESTRFYWQAAAGQWRILQAREDIAPLLERGELDKATSQKLQRVLALREFARTELKLPVGNHYSQYVALDRPYVVWNVFAAPDDAITPKTWCFPIAGCVSYRGYFAEEDARAYAAKLAADGWDTYVGGVGAYSTLGWFDDPVLSSFLYDDPARLAALLFHELAHQQLYVQDDSTFNESFATAVELIALQRWLDAQGNSDQFERVMQQEQRHQAFVALVLAHRQLRQQRYHQLTDDTELAQLNRELAAQLRQDYQTFKQQWQHYAGYDRWFDGPLNNAQLATVATYRTLLPGFLGLFQSLEEDLPAFYAACARLADLDKTERHARLQAFSESLPRDSLYFAINP